MNRKKKTKKVRAKKSRAIAKREAASKPIFTGAQALMAKPKSEQAQKERNLVLFSAKALGINPFGVNVLGNLPYTNNIGRKEKIVQYDKHARFEYDWKRLSENDMDKAVCRARIVTVKNKKEIPLTDWVVGECSPATTKMSTLKGYQNHIAQTRAENRAFEAAFGNRLRQEMFKNVQLMLSRGEATPEIAEKALAAGGPSAEEMSNEKPAKAAPMLAEKTAKSDPVQLAANFIINARSVNSLDAAEKRIKENPGFNENNRTYLLGLVAKRKKQLAK